MSTRKRGKVGEDGVPLEPDIEKLVAAYPANTLTQGRILSHADLSRVIGWSYRTNRYREVTNGWRRMLRKYDPPIFIEFDKGDHGHGPRVLDDPGKVRHVRKKVHLAGVGIRKAVAVSNDVDRTKLDETEVAYIDNQSKRLNALRAAHNMRPRSSKKRDSGFDRPYSHASQAQQEAAAPA